MDACVGMWIDWSAGRWRIWDLATRQKLGEAGHVVIHGAIELVNEENNTRGFAVTAGHVVIENDRAIIRR